MPDIQKRTQDDTLHHDQVLLPLRGEQWCNQLRQENPGGAGRMEWLQVNSRICGDKFELLGAGCSPILDLRVQRHHNAYEAIDCAGGPFVT